MGKERTGIIGSKKLSNREATHQPQSRHPRIGQTLLIMNPTALIKWLAELIVTLPGELSILK
jgi:hypothetical protein